MARKIKKTAKRLNIKSAKASRLARQIAKLTGESITAVVTVALREKLERVRDSQRRYAAILKIARQGRRMFKGPFIDHAEFLYDDKGLPK